MDSNVKEKWVSAFRSGRYKQTTGCLRKDDAFCCLGVLCDVMGAVWTSQGDARAFGSLQSYYLGPEALSKISLSDSAQELLYRMNDDGKSFDEIADYIADRL